MGGACVLAAAEKTANDENSDGASKQERKSLVFFCVGLGDKERIKGAPLCYTWSAVSGGTGMEAY
jgi:hypothetical protein